MRREGGRRGLIQDTQKRDTRALYIGAILHPPPKKGDGILDYIHTDVPLFFTYNKRSGDASRKKKKRSSDASRKKKKKQQRTGRGGFQAKKKTKKKICDDIFPCLLFSRCSQGGDTIYNIISLQGTRCCFREGSC